MRIIDPLKRIRALEIASQVRFWLFSRPAGAAESLDWSQISSHRGTSWAVSGQSTLF